VSHSVVRINPDEMLCVCWQILTYFFKLQYILDVRDCKPSRISKFVRNIKRSFRFKKLHNTLLTYLLTYLLNYLLPLGRALLEKQTVPYIVKKFPVFYGTLRFIAAFTSARYLSLSWAGSIQSMPLHFTAWRPFLILYSHLRLSLQSSLFPSVFTILVPSLHNI